MRKLSKREIKKAKKGFTKLLKSLPIDMNSVYFTMVLGCCDNDSSVIAANIEIGNQPMWEENGDIFYLDFDGDTWVTLER